MALRFSDLEWPDHPRMQDKSQAEISTDNEEQTEEKN